MKRRRVPDYGRAPVVPEKDCPFLAEVIDEADHVANHAFHVVVFDRVGLVAAAVAAHIGYDYAIPGVAHRANLVTP